MTAVKAAQDVLDFFLSKCLNSLIHISKEKEGGSIKIYRGTIYVNMVFDDSKFFSRIWVVPNSMEHGETGEDSGYLSAVGSRFIRVQLGKRFKKENKTNNCYF